MKVLSVIALALFVACAFGQQIRPQPSETFEAHALVDLLINNKTKADGQVFWAAIQSKGLEIETMRVNGQPNLDNYVLARYDLGALYTINGNNNHTCQKHTLTGKMPLIWSWVVNATYQGKQTVNGQVLDIWQYTQGYAVLTLGVTSVQPNIPVMLKRQSPQLTYTAFFHTFQVLPPHPAIFAVPQTCNQANHFVASFARNAKRCLAGSTMIARAQVWVNNRVPYNQGATYEGYREDCSGYVSMAWELSMPGYTTSTLPQVSHPISKGSLQPGDIILNAGEHVVLFGGWADSAQTHYYGYEETQPGEGTIKSVVPYPYWYETSSFLPYSYNSIC